MILSKSKSCLLENSMLSVKMEDIEICSHYDGEPPISRIGRNVHLQTANFLTKRKYNCNSDWLATMGLSDLAEILCSTVIVRELEDGYWHLPSCVIIFLYTNEPT
jgi:hypothetical protein